MYEPIKLANGNIDWDAENRRRRATPQPTVNQPVARQPEPKARTLGEQIAWNSAVNNAVNSMGKIVDVAEDLGFEPADIEMIKARANQIYKLIIE